MAMPITVSEAELRAAHRSLDEPVSFEAMAQCPALFICLRNIAEIRARGRARGSNLEAVNNPASALSRFDRLQRRDLVDLKRAAANDRD